MALGDPYISRDELKDVIGITSDDENILVDRALRGATMAIDNRSRYVSFWNTGTPVARTVETMGRIVPVRRSASPYYKLLLNDGIASASGFAVSGYSSATLLPSDAIATGKPATEIKLPWGTWVDDLVITALWGWPSVPDDIIWACQTQAHRYYRRRGSPEGIAGSAEWGLVRVPNLDPDVKAILEGGGYLIPGVG